MQNFTLRFSHKHFFFFINADLHHQVTLGNHVDINHTVQSQSIPASIGAMEGGGNYRAIPVSIPHPPLIGQARGRNPYIDMKQS